MKKSTFKNMFKMVPDKKARYFQAVPEVQKVEVPATEAPPVPVASSSAPGSSMFPNDTVIYRDNHRDFVISTSYDSSSIRPLPLFYIAIGYKGGEDNQAAIIPLTLHHGHDKTGPIYGYVEGIERHAKGTILNHAYNLEAPFKTTILDIGAHITKEYCEFMFYVPSADKTTREPQKFKWKQCKGSPEVLALAKERAVEAHDWCWIDRKNDRGMKLFQENTGEVLAVFVAGKSHSKMNPLRVAAKIKWFESETWTEELKLAAFLAVMTYGEKTRRGGTGAGA